MTKISFDIENTQGWRAQNLQVSINQTSVNSGSFDYPADELNMCLRRDETIWFYAYLHRETGTDDPHEWVIIDAMTCGDDDILEDAVKLVLYDPDKNTLTTLYDLLAGYALEQFK